jgi:hypothetical protein
MPTSIPTQLLPLRECCEDCLLSVERALLSENYEVKWSPGARRKKQLDEEEERRDQEVVNYIGTVQGTHSTNHFPRLKLLDEFALCQVKTTSFSDDLLRLAPFAEEETEQEDKLAPLPSQTDNVQSSPPRTTPISPKRSADAVFPTSTPSSHTHHNRFFNVRRTASDTGIFENRRPLDDSALATSDSPGKPKPGEGFSWVKGSANVIKGLSSGGAGGLITVG